MEAIFIPRPKFDEMTKASSVQTISEKGTAKALIKYDRKEFVVTGTMSTGASGYLAVWAIQAVDLSVYDGKLKPLNYHDQHTAYTRNERARGYTGMLITYQERQMVLVGKQITFKPTENGRQTSLF